MPESRPASVGERRTITALFCDVVGSTTLAEQLDPEDWVEILNGALERLTIPIYRYEGIVNKLVGDAIVAFFGVPNAHEDDPVRAVRAALDMMAALQPYRDEVRQKYKLDFNVRVGINTGPVVVADVGSPLATDHTAMGDAVNVAARMEQTAAPGTIQISEETHRLVAPLFDTEALGAIELKGKSEPVPAFRVTGAKAVPGRLRGLDGVRARMVGRDAEFERLRDVIHKVQDGRGQIACIIGEAGVGKSRLVSELRDEWNKRGNVDEDWDVMNGIPYDMSRPFSLFLTLARNMFGVEIGDTAEVIHEKIAHGIRTRGGTEDQVSLCTVGMERVMAARVLHDSNETYTTEEVNQDIYDVLYRGVRESCSTGPTVLLVDDLHWGDKASVDLLAHLMPLVDEVPILFLYAFRAERQSPGWQLKVKAERDFPHRYAEVTLKPLSSEATDELVSELLDIADLPRELRQLILRKADGNPYFVEEIVRTLIDDGIVIRSADGLRWHAATRIEDIAIPDTLQALLMSRIDRLDAETKSTLQVASVIGRSFYYKILKAISDQAMAIDRHLGSLERVELVTEAGRRPELEYMFRHELARDAAYGSMLNRRRREFHRRVGEALEQIFPDRVEEHAHLMAQHFLLAGEDAKAANYFEIAGDAAIAVHATNESGLLFDRAIEAAERVGLGDAADRLRAKRMGVIAAAQSGWSPSATVLYPPPN
ncbi:MAG: adenylate/guanylate cyclase domain-containing protein [Bauldia sp.]